MPCTLFTCCLRSCVVLMQAGPPRKTLVLDLDLTLIETLVMRQMGACPPDFVYCDSLGVRAQVWKRPHLQAFLEAAAKVRLGLCVCLCLGGEESQPVCLVLDPGAALDSNGIPV